MGFWSNLAKGAGIAGAGVGGLFTGGGTWATLAPLLAGGADALSTIGRVAGDTAGGVQQQRNFENETRLGYDRNALTRAGMGIDQSLSRDSQALQRAALLEKMGLDRAQLGIDAPMARTRQAAFGDALNNVQDVNVAFAPRTGALPKFNVSGGLRPSMFGPNAREAGGELGRQALLALMTKSDIPAAASVPEASPLVDLPELAGPQGSGALEKILGGTGIGANILGGLGEYFKRRRKPVMELS